MVRRHSRSVASDIEKVETVTDASICTRALFVATTVLLALEVMRGRGGRSKTTTTGPVTA